MVEISQNPPKNCLFHNFFFQSVLAFWGNFQKVPLPMLGLFFNSKMANFHQKKIIALIGPSQKKKINLSNILKTHWKLDGSMVRISWEHIENTKNPTTPISQKIAWAPWALAERSFFAYLCSLPFLAQANGRSRNYGIMFVCLKSLANTRTSLLSLHTRFAKK